MWAFVLYRLAPGRLVSERLGFPLSNSIHHWSVCIHSGSWPVRDSISTAVHSVAAASRGFFFLRSVQHPFEVVCLGAFAKFRKATIASSCLPLSLFAWNSSASTGRVYMWFDIWVYFRKICWETWRVIKIWQEKQALCIKKYAHFWYPAEFCLEWEAFYVWRWCGKIWYSQTRYRWQYAAHALWMLDDTHTHARTICNPCWFSMRIGYAKAPNFVRTLPVF